MVHNKFDHTARFTKTIINIFARRSGYDDGRTQAGRSLKAKRDKNSDFRDG